MPEGSLKYYQGYDRSRDGEAEEGLDAQKPGEFVGEDDVPSEKMDPEEAMIASERDQAEARGEEDELARVVGARPVEMPLLEGEKEAKEAEAEEDEKFRKIESEVEEKYPEFEAKTIDLPVSKVPETVGVRKAAKVVANGHALRRETRHEVIRKNPTLEQAKLIKRKKKAASQSSSEMR